MGTCLADLVAERKLAAERLAALDAEITICLAGSRSVPEPHLITAHFGCELDGLHALAPDNADSELM